MNAKTKIVLVLVIIVGVAGISVEQEQLQLASAKALQIALAENYASMKKEVEQLREQWQDEQKSEAARVAAVTVSESGQTIDADHILLSKESIEECSFDLIGLDFKLTSDAVGFLGLSTEEAKQLQTVFTGMKERVQEYQRKSVKELDPAAIGKFHTHDGMVNPVKTAIENNGTDQSMGSGSASTSHNSDKLSVYEIPAMSDEENAAMRQWFSDSVAKVIGPDRAEVVLQKARENSGADFWLQPGKHVLLAFMDRGNVMDGTDETYWLEEETDDAGSSGANMGAGSDAVPAEWAYLFEEVKDGAAATAAAGSTNGAP